MRYALILIALLFLLVFRSTYAAPAYQFGVIPYLAPSRLEAIYAPLVNELSHMLHRRVYLRTSSTKDKFTSNLKDARYDIAIVNPFESIVALDNYGYVALAMRPKHRSSIVVLHDSPIRELEDLRGTTIGTASARSPMTYFALHALGTHGLEAGKDYQVQYFPTPQACLHHLIIGDIDACGAGGGETARMLTNRRNIQLRTIISSIEHPSMVFVVHDRVPQSDRKIIQKTLLEWRSKYNVNSHGGHWGGIPSFIPYRKDDYDIIRQHYNNWWRIDHVSP
jgi:phosphonate transport system substrate-binding protein